METAERSTPRSSPAPDPVALPRVLGLRRGDLPGTTLIVCAGMHGNEPSGVHACRRVLERLEGLAPKVKGEVVFVVGNRQALAAQRRYLERDLNRAWCEAGFRRLEEDPSLRARTEGLEQTELGAVLEECIARARGPVVVLDLHSFSAEGPPFAILGDTLRNRRIALALHVPIILGLEETLDGTLLDWLVEQGHVALAVEGGQHDAPQTVDRHEALLWCALVAAGCIEEREVQEEVARGRVLLDEASEGVPPVVEIVHRQALGPEDRFRMRPGYVNYQEVAAGEVLASDRAGDVRSPLRARILMPLYQQQGDDGFFLARPVRMFWLKLSAVCRKVHLGRFLVPLLPGVCRHPERDRTLVVDPRVARWLVVEVFRLLGYRRRAPENGFLVFSRRRP